MKHGIRIQLFQFARFLHNPLENVTANCEDLLAYARIPSVSIQAWGLRQTSLEEVFLRIAIQSEQEAAVPV